MARFALHGLVFTVCFMLLVFTTTPGATECDGAPCRQVVADEIWMAAMLFVGVGLAGPAAWVGLRSSASAPVSTWWALEGAALGIGLGGAGLNFATPLFYRVWRDDLLQRPEAAAAQYVVAAVYLVLAALVWVQVFHAMRRQAA